MAIVLAGCSINQEVLFDEVACNPEAFPENQIFVPCREYTYLAKFWDKHYNLLSEERVWMMATGRPWAYDEENQQEIAIQYRFDDDAIPVLNANTINPEMQTDWRLGEVTGIMESNDEVFMHPFRSNQYVFTEIVPFPSVRLPLEEGIGWTSNLNIYEGWGRWSGLTVNCTYRVMGKETVEIPFQNLESWRVSSVGTTDPGTSTHEFWFHETYGFVKMVIQNYEGQLLTFELESVK